MATRMGKAVPSLKSFMQRAHVLAQFRKFLRVAQALEAPQRSDVTAHVKAEFRKHATVSDPGQVRTLLVTGARQLEKLEELAGWAHTQAAPATAGVWPWTRTCGDEPSGRG